MPRGTEKVKEYLSQDSQPLSQDLDPMLPQCNAKLLNIMLQHTVLSIAI
jgi:hypothetical protein